MFLCVLWYAYHSMKRDTYLYQWWAAAAAAAELVSVLLSIPALPVDPDFHLW
jgi:hypothetical protein